MRNRRPNCFFLTRSFLPTALTAVALLNASPTALRAQRTVSSWLTTPDSTNLVKKQTPIHFTRQHASAAAINVDDSQTFQTMDGFGHAVTGGSAELLEKMSPTAREALLKELFGNGPGQMNMSYIRVSIGASDMNDHVYTYDDLPAGDVDPEMSHFSLTPDEAYVLPVLKQIVSIQPGIKILASPWTPPDWMKDNNLPKGGTLKKEFYPAYALYLVKYLQGMAANGVPITALTVQNEPENPKNTPSMVFTAEQEADFIGTALGPGLQKAGLHTEVIAFDHNCDHPQYPITVLKDPTAGKYTSGSGFHLYLGEINALTTVHDAFPRKDIFFTEQMVIPHKSATSLEIAEPVARILVGATENWSRNVLLWNLAADPQNGPHTNNGGCPICSGAITLDGDSVKRNLAYYVTAHLTPFVPAGSVRIGSPGEGVSLPHVAFRTPTNRHVLLVSNTKASDSTFAIRYKGKEAVTTLPAGSVATYVW